ncbi:DUF2007 domain-containing protein [Roseomonas sp. OT10]|uniref:putative signal transducing protein n=1 Tax=Roseomonas cutis TaxID=2897332 RepID=UPI001E639389|nr:DUF2007 domain-containing protein [Roseomonas sp. OT10]UFN50976.1 DUF2007 domain-containing protein [Roseomonas sp. OT10]
MRVVATTNDLVRLGFLASLLRDAGIEPIVLDQHVSAMEGSIGAFPRRLAVRDGDASAALAILHQAGEVPG